MSTRTHPLPRALAAASLWLLSGALLAPAALAQAQSPRGNVAAGNAAAEHPSRAFWLDQRQAAAARSAAGAERVLPANRFRALTLDSASLAGLLQSAPAEASAAARQNPLIIALPDPAGGFQRFRVVDSPVMEPALAARHPNIRTYAGRGVDDATATLRLSITPLGLQASVRSSRGGWYVDPVYHLDQSLYGSFWRRDAVPNRAPLTEPFVAQAMLQPERNRYRADETVSLQGAGFAPQRTVMVSITTAPWPPASRPSRTRAAAATRSRPPTAAPRRAAATRWWRPASRCWPRWARSCAPTGWRCSPTRPTPASSAPAT
jgi:hypothetical protein